MATPTVRQLTYPNSKCIAQNLTVSFPGIAPIHSFRLYAPEGFSIDNVQNDATKPQTVFTISYNPFGKYRVKREVPAPSAAYIEYKIGDLDSGMKGSVQFELVVEPNVDESEAITCGSCIRKFSDSNDNLKPRILSCCGHSFCTECLRKLQKIDHLRKTIKIMCPIDKMVTNTLVMNLPFNFDILKTVREMQGKEAKDLWNVDDPIVPCYENDKHESAVYCVGCKESYCYRCFQSAHSSKFMAKHTSIPVSEKPAFIPMCPNHPDKEAEFVCNQPDCDLPKILCSLCKRHRGHNTMPIAKKIEEHTQYLKNHIQQLMERERTLERQIENHKEIELSMHPQSETMKKLRTEIDADLDAKQRECHRKLAQMVKIVKNV